MERLPLTAVKIDELKRLKQRAGFGAVARLTRHPDLPSGLTAPTVFGWLSGDIRTARKDHLQFVEQHWSRSVAVVAITEELRNELLAQKARTGSGLNAGIITSWLRGDVKSADKMHLDYVLHKWAEISPVIPITKSLRDKLAALKHSRGLTWAQIHQELPEIRGKPSVTTLARWANGQAKTASADVIEQVLDWLLVQPDAANTPISQLDRSLMGGRRMPLTPEIRQRLNRAREITGDWKSLMNYLSPCPKDLTPQALSHWATGILKSAPGDHLLFVLDGIEDLIQKQENR